MQHGPTASHVDMHHTKKTQVHLRYKSMVRKVATPEGAPQGRTNMDPRDTHRNIPLRTLTTPRDILVAKLVPNIRRKERRGNIPRVMTPKSLRKPNCPPSMEKLRRGKRFGCLA